MRVYFGKSEDGRRCSWRAELAGHRRLPGSTMAARPAGTGRQLVAAYRAELNEVEGIGNAQVQVWPDGRPTPPGRALRAMAARWRALQPGGELVVEWPTRRLPRPSLSVRHVPARRRRVPR